MNKLNTLLFTIIISTNIYGNSNLPDLSGKILLLNRMSDKIIATRTELRIIKSELIKLQAETDSKKVSTEQSTADKDVLLHKEHLLTQKLAVYKKGHRDLKQKLERITESKNYTKIKPQSKKSTCSSLKDLLTCKMI